MFNYTLMHIFYPYSYYESIGLMVALPNMVDIMHLLSFELFRGVRS